MKPGVSWVNAHPLLRSKLVVISDGKQQATTYIMIMRVKVYRPEIDGLRAVAVVAIILFHLGVPGFSGGYVGVDAFFVLSGYLIGRNSLADIEIGRFTWRAFIERRARRIIPALLATLAISLAVAVATIEPLPLEAMARSAIAALVFVPNLFFWQETHGYFGFRAGILPLLHLWSLGVEEQFYLLFPPAFMLAMRWTAPTRRLAVAAALVTSLALHVAAGWIAPAAGFFLLPTRIWEFMLGLYIALREPPGGRPRNSSTGTWQGYIGALFLVLAIIIPANPLLVAHPWLRSIPATFGVALILEHAFTNRGVARILAVTPAVGVGLISYSLYLWHQPIIVLWRLAAPDEASAGIKAALLLTTLIFAILSWKLVEQPFRNPRIAGGRTFAIVIIMGALTLLVAASLLVRSGGWPQRYSPAQRVLLAAWPHYRDQMHSCLPDPQQATLPRTPCVVGEGGEISVAIIGDSHAAAISPAVEKALTGSRTRAVLLTHSGCPPIMDRSLLGPLLTNCAPFTRAALERVLSNPRIRTVVFAARWSFYFDREVFDNGEGGVEQDEPLVPLSQAQRRHWEQAVSRPIRILLATGRRVVLVYPVPEAGWNVPSRMVKGDILGLRDPSLSLARYLQRSKSAFDALDRIGQDPQLVRLYPADGLCQASTGRCLLIKDGLPLYVDDDHLSSLGALYALRPHRLRGALITDNR